MVLADGVLVGLVGDPRARLKRPWRPSGGGWTERGPQAPPWPRRTGPRRPRSARSASRAFRPPDNWSRHGCGPGPGTQAGRRRDGTHVRRERDHPGERGGRGRGQTGQAQASPARRARERRMWRIGFMMISLGLRSISTTVKRPGQPVNREKCPAWRGRVPALAAGMPRLGPRCPSGPPRGPRPSGTTRRSWPGPRKRGGARSVRR